MIRAAVRLAACLVVAGLWCVPARADDALPQLTAPVNDFAGVVGETHAQAMDRMIRALQSSSGDVVVVATIRTFAPYPDIREYAVKLFENGGRGIGEKGKDNGLLVLLAVDDRRVWVEVGYDLEGIVTDGFAGETSRQVMAPRFREGEYGAGLEEGVRRIVGRIAQGRNVTLEGVPEPPAGGGVTISPATLVTLIIIAIVLFRIIGTINRFNRPRGWGRRRTWSGWHSGVGPFGGGFGGGWGSGGGGFGGGFGGFGGGRSGGGGGGASW